jgi:hypothetical protein
LLLARELSRQYLYTFGTVVYIISALLMLEVSTYIILYSINLGASFKKELYDVSMAFH